LKKGPELRGGGFGQLLEIAEHHLAVGTAGGQGVGLAGLGQREGGRDPRWLQLADGKAAGKTSDGVKLSSCSARLFGGGGEGDGFVVVLSGEQAVVQAAEEAGEQVALGGGVPVAGVFAPVVVGAGAG
jgi:hypothetical protein